MCQVARIDFGERFYNATVHINSTGPDPAQCLLFQTTPGRAANMPGGHRSVLRCTFDEPPAAGATHRKIGLRVVATHAGEWAFEHPVANRGPREAQGPRTVEVDVPEENVVFWVGAAAEAAEAAVRTATPAVVPVEVVSV